jgi:hypothetical protein
MHSGIRGFSFCTIVLGECTVAMEMAASGAYVCECLAHSMTILFAHLHICAWEVHGGHGDGSKWCINL